MATTPITNSGGIGTSVADTTASTSDTGLDKDAFLKILMSQMSNMDPLSSSSQDPSQMTQQLTQYSILEQITNLNTSAKSSELASAHSQALSLIGKEVTYLPDGETATPVTGTVKSVQVGTDGYPTLTVGSTSKVGLGQIMQVAQPGDTLPVNTGSDSDTDTETDTDTTPEVP
jgi:flagellar basal-body rod modification protein FlgD